MISAQDTVLPRRTGHSSAWDGRFLRNVPLTTGEGPTDVIGLLRGGGRCCCFSGSGAAGMRSRSGSLRVVHAAPAPEISCDALLVRPDGCIAWAPDGDELASALTAYLGPGRATGRGRVPALSQRWSAGPARPPAPAVRRRPSRHGSR
ncbi:hypothetical protein [Streptomyces sp. NPDC017964]|uniref:aromatic-ring hydroxylase C-terminal domain-containing protein n=1 Tax=Streptomyces sp. NPDC017964 TaxID=3365022 RepID=UPI00379BA898